MPPPADPPTAAAQRGLRSGRPTPSMRAHRGRPTPLTLSPRRSAAAWPRRRRPEPRRRLLCLAPPLGFAEPGALPPRAARASPTTEPLPRAAVRAAASHRRRRPLGLRLGAAARHAVRCRAGKKPLPLTSGARWSVV